MYRSYPVLPDKKNHTNQLLEQWTSDSSHNYKCVMGSGVLFHHGQCVSLDRCEPQFHIDLESVICFGQRLIFAWSGVSKKRDSDVDVINPVSYKINNKTSSNER